MKLRSILFVLASLSFLTAATGGYLYYSSLKKSAIIEANRQNSAGAIRAKNLVSSFLSQNLKSVKALAGLKELEQVLERPNAASLVAANSILDHFQDTLQADVCYLMDSAGKTIAASNRNTPGSFVGKNYAFRPYFQKAIQGLPEVYMALGVTSNKRGVYFSHPVFLGAQARPVGVVVVKDSVENIELELAAVHNSRDAITLITDPNGVIFISNYKAWLYHTLWRISDKDTSEILKTRQFGKGSLEWIGLVSKDRNQAALQSGVSYLIHQEEIDRYPGWSAYHLTNLQSICKGIYNPLINIKTAGSITILLCVLVGISVFVLYKIASSDIRQRKIVEEALRASEANYRAIFNAANDAVFVHEMQTGRILDVNQKMCEMYGYTPEEACQLSVGDLSSSVSPYTQKDALKWITKATDGDPQLFEWMAKDKSGRLFWVEVNLKRTNIREKDRLLAVVRDISERKRAEKALRASELKYKNIFNNAQVGLGRTRISDGRVLECNEKMAQIFGYNNKLEFINEFVFAENYVDPGVRKKMLIEVEKTGVVNNVTARFYRKDGKILWARFDTQIFPEHGYMEDVVVDITEQKKAEDEKKTLQAELQQAQKMESIGTLAGGIAHDFNNILSAIIGYTELSLTEAKKETVLYNNLQEVLQAGGRAKDLVKQILTFSRQADLERKPVQVKLIITEALRFLRASLPTTIEIRQELRCDSLVMADSTQVHQVLMNLCTNAAHAMREKGGVLGVMLTDANLDTGFTAKHPELKPGAYLELTVSDTGHGMPSNIQDRIFDPFFTTKDKSEGTGMGLAVVHGIVGSNGGTITVASTPGQGTIFKVYLPAVERQLELQTHVAETIPTGAERILFIDDEPALVNLGKRTLESLGYRVTTRTSSLEALELFKAKPHSFDLVITDMTMPNMTGDELAKELIQINPEMPVILCTGYSARINQQKAKVMGIRALVSKPVLKREIAETIRKVLI